MKKIPLIVIAGPTASGKTALSVELAARLGAEIISADSMQIYKEMNIATAKPTEEEMRGIRHHLIDFLPTDKPFSVADYCELAHKAVEDIASRKKLPIVCGGTGLYIDSLTQNIQFEKTCSATDIRAELKQLAEEKGSAHLLEMLREIDPETAERLHENNLNRIIRAIEIYRTTGVTMSEQIKSSKLAGAPYDTLMLCLDYKDRGVLYERIDRRVDMMLESGLVGEAKRFASDPTLATSRQAIGYKELAPYFSGDISLDEAVENLKRSTRRYAKRQLTWFRRYENAVWLYPDEFSGLGALADKAEGIIKEFLEGGDYEI